ncbi:helix-turn-helix domain-containing protein [Kitasatospora misakiensis]|uniref:Helix-turn-helix domain-containing protein n=1 Tax=Kitasatospora misakiensis TaxID=67330 RepID=A0ABW0X615_9ACTN
MGVETDEFAGMLRALKERSGHSYGVLATRLHASTSTLHRYCNGAAVPAEYAPVERFARACGASAAELVELHRCWIVADAARRREAGAAASKPQPARAATTLAPEAAEPAPGQQPAPAPEPQADPVTVTTVPSPGPSARPGRRRSRVVLGAVAVVGLVVAVPAVVLQGRAEPSATASAEPPSVSPTSSAPPSSPSPAPAASTPAASTPAASTSATAAPVDETSAPFHVNVLTDNWGSPCGQWFLSPRPPGQVTVPPDSSADSDSWAAAQQAVPGGHLRLQLTAQGADATPVVLHAAYIQVVSTQPAPKGNAYTPGSGCGGALTPAAFAVDLDAPAPRAVPVPAEGTTGKSALSNFPYRVSATDPQVLNVDATTASQDVSWNLYLVWSSGDRQGRLRVDNHGRPFHTVGIRDAPAYSYNGKKWSPTQPDL